MHPTGIEPALKASEASVLSIRLRVQSCEAYYNFAAHETLIKILQLYYIYFMRITVSYNSTTFSRCPAPFWELRKSSSFCYSFLRESGFFPLLCRNSKRCPTKILPAAHSVRSLHSPSDTVQTGFPFPCPQAEEPHGRSWAE